MLLEEIFPGENLEDTTTEFKGVLTEGNDAEIKWLRTLAAFANTQGGKLYVGVEDKTHKVVALDHAKADKISLMIHRQIAERIDPALDYEIEAYPCPGFSPTRYVLCVHVKRSKSLPVTLRSGGLLGVYIRRFGRTETATAEQLRELILQSDNVPYDQPFTEKMFREENFTQLCSFCKERTGNSLSEKELMSMGFISPERKLSKGALLFADACNDEITRIALTQWPADTKGSDTVIASQVYTGNLLGAIQAAQEFVANHSVNGFKKTADSRVDYIAYPARSVTEGIVNAIGHRNYYISGAQIEINIFKDRLEVTSPGALLGVRELVREHNIAAIIPRRRNEVICAVLTACKLMEEKGSGFDKIEQDYAGNALAHLPFVSADSTSFTLTLPDLTYEGGVIGEGSEFPNLQTKDVMNIRKGLDVLSFCYRKERTAAEIAEYLDMTPSSYFRKNILGVLVEQSYLLTHKKGRVSVFITNPQAVILR